MSKKIVHISVRENSNENLTLFDMISSENISTRATQVDQLNGYGDKNLQWFVWDV